MDIPYGFYKELFENLFSEKVAMSHFDEEVNRLAAKYQRNERQLKSANDGSRDTSIADYVWLPLKFVDPCEEYPNGIVLIKWKNEWKIEDYE